MTVDELIKELQKLSAEGYGEKQVTYDSGCCVVHQTSYDETMDVIDVTSYR